MSKEKSDFLPVTIKYCFRIVTVIQLIFGVFWIAGNITGYQHDFMANCYVSASETLVVDDYMGILYAVCVRILGHGALLYISQLALTALSAWLLFRDLWITGFIVSFPFVLQCDFLVSPAGLTFACILTGAYAFKRFYGSGKYRYGFLAVSLAIVSALLNPDYAFLAPVLCAPVCIVFAFKKRYRSLIILAMIIIGTFCASDYNARISDTYAYGSGAKTLSFLKMERLLQNDFRKHAQTVRQCFAVELQGEMENSDLIPEMLRIDFAPKFEAATPLETAVVFYDYISDNARSRGLRYYGVPIARDIAYYAVSPFSALYVYSMGKSDTVMYSAFADFVKNMSGMSYFYMLFSLIASSLLALLSLVLLIYNLIYWRSRVNFGFLACGLFVLAVLVLYDVLICPRGYDYRNALYVSIFWPLLFAFAEKKGDCK